MHLDVATSQIVLLSLLVSLAYLLVMLVLIKLFGPLPGWTEESPLPTRILAGILFLPAMPAVIALLSLVVAGVALGPGVAWVVLSQVVAKNLGDPVALLLSLVVLAGSLVWALVLYESYWKKGKLEGQLAIASPPVLSLGAVVAAIRILWSAGLMASVIGGSIIAAALLVVFRIAHRRQVYPPYRFLRGILLILLLLMVGFTTTQLVALL